MSTPRTNRETENLAMTEVFECISYFRLVNVFLYYHLSLKKTLLPFSSKMSLLNGLAEIKTCHEDMPRKLKKISVWGFFFISVIVEVGQLNRSKYRWSCILNGSYFVGSRKEIIGQNTTRLKAKILFYADVTSLFRTNIE